MINFKYDFSFLLQMIKYVFLPVLMVVILTAFIIYIYSRKVKKEDIKRYNYVVEFWTTLLAILIIGALFAVTVGFALSLSDTIEMYNLVEGNEIIYYLVLGTPLIPLIFLVAYAYRFINVLLSKPKSEKKIVKEEDIVPEPTMFKEEKVEEVIQENKVSDEVEIDVELSSPIVVPERSKKGFFEQEDNKEQSQEIYESVEEVVETEDKNIRITPIVVPERVIYEIADEPDTSSSLNDVEEIELL